MSNAMLALATSPLRPLRGPPALYVRQPYLGSPPAVQLVNGLGSGSGAYITNNGSDADQSQGLVALKVGLNPAGTGNLALNFPAGVVTGQYVFAAEWATLTPAPPAGNVLVIGWTATRPLVTGELLLLAYQWAVSS